MLSVGDTELNLSTHPSVILVIGVNGVGKTTTIGKIAKQLTSQGKKVMLVAGIPSGRLPQTSWKSGRAEAARPSSASTRGRTRLRGV